MFQNNGYSDILNEIYLLVFHTMNIVIFHNLEYNNQIVYTPIRKKTNKKKPWRCYATYDS